MSRVETKRMMERRKKPRRFGGFRRRWEIQTQGLCILFFGFWICFLVGYFSWVALYSVSWFVVMWILLPNARCGRRGSVLVLGFLCCHGMDEWSVCVCVRCVVRIFGVQSPVYVDLWLLNFNDVLFMCADTLRLCLCGYGVRFRHPRDILTLSPSYPKVVSHGAAFAY